MTILNELFVVPVSEEAVGLQYSRVRARTLQLAAPLSEEDCCVQSMADASPIKWHLAHTTWFFETFLLKRFEPNFRPFHRAFEVMFNSYYTGIGDQYPRTQRGLLTRPGLLELRAYRQNVDERVRQTLEECGGERELLLLLTLGINHEQQHQELMLTDIKHLFSLSPLKPAYQATQNRLSASVDAIQWIDFDGGIVEVGHDGEGFCFDNETPRHRQYLQPYRLASRLVTNGEYVEFVEDGGYGNPQFWLSEGWDWVRSQQLSQPLYWQRDKAEWQEFTLGGMQRLDPNLPVAHVSYFEADAYARWRDARLPTETEWERAVASRKLQGNFADNNLFHPERANGKGLTQMFGDTWEWTRSSYAPYPGYRLPEGAIGEYNGKFMVNQYVLRGGSCATPRDHVRPTYRNFFPANARWQFSGIRLASDPF